MPVLGTLNKDTAHTTKMSVLVAMLHKMVIFVFRAISLEDSRSLRRESGPRFVATCLVRRKPMLFAVIWGLHPKVRHEGNDFLYSCIFLFGMMVSY